ncbi:MAG TPA: hypothetical protein VKM55_29445 [Candidatus Lokiarchaeia archaeon]|nr:hypothetical protein [Candidatus Lokiarchaeia archaeon]
MASLISPSLFIDGMYAIFVIIDSIYLLTRAIRLKSLAIVMLVFAFITFLTTEIINGFVAPGNNLVRSLTSVLYPIFIIIYTKMFFYVGKKSKFKMVLVIVVTLRVIEFIETNISGYAVPTYQSVPPDRYGLYYFHVIVVVAQLCVSFSWLSWASFKAYSQSKQEKVELWVRKRYLLIGVSNALYVFGAFAFFIEPIDGLAYASPNGLASDIVIPTLVMGYFILSTLAFVVPSWFKHLLNSRQVLKKVGKDDELFQDISPAIVDQAMNSSQVLHAIDYLGGKLAVMIDKKPDAAKGFIMMAIEKETGELGLSVLRLDNLLRVVNNSLKQMMIDFHIDGYDYIVTKLSDEIVKNQSLFLMIAL